MLSMHIISCSHLASVRKSFLFDIKCSRRSCATLSCEALLSLSYLANYPCMTVCMGFAAKRRKPTSFGASSLYYNTFCVHLAHITRYRRSKLFAHKSYLIMNIGMICSLHFDTLEWGYQRQISVAHLKNFRCLVLGLRQDGKMHSRF